MSDPERCARCGHPLAISGILDARSRGGPLMLNVTGHRADHPGSCDCPLGFRSREGKP